MLVGQLRIRSHCGSEVSSEGTRADDRHEEDKGTKSIKFLIYKIEDLGQGSFSNRFYLQDHLFKCSPPKKTQYVK